MTRRSAITAFLAALAAMLMPWRRKPAPLPVRLVTSVGPIDGILSPWDGNAPKSSLVCLRSESWTQDVSGLRTEPTYGVGLSSWNAPRKAEPVAAEFDG